MNNNLPIFPGAGVAPIDFFPNSAHMKFGLNGLIPPVAPTLTIPEVTPSLEHGYTGPYRQIPSASCPSKRYQPPTVLPPGNNPPQSVPMTQPRSCAVRNVDELMYPTIPSVRDPVNVHGFAQSLQNFESQKDRTLSSNYAPAQSNSYFLPLGPSFPLNHNPKSAPAPVPVPASRTNFSSPLYHIPSSVPTSAAVPASRTNFSSPPYHIPSSVPTSAAAPAQPFKRLSSPVSHISPPDHASVQAFEHFASMLRNTSPTNSKPAPAQSNQGQSSQLHYISPSPPTPPESSFSTATDNTIPYRSLENESEIESLHSDDLEDILIGHDTPEHVRELILAAIEVTPYMLPGEKRCPAEFVVQYETYADLLKLNDEQKRVIFPNYAYRDDRMRFEALIFDSTYEEMKNSFFEFSCNRVVISSFDKIAKKAGPRKSG